MKSFTSKPAAAGKPVDFELDGVTYTFTPPKTSSNLVAILQIKGSSNEANLARAAAMLDWFIVGLNKQHLAKPAKKYLGHEDFVEDCQACQIDARLKDADDDLEIETVMDVITGLMEETSGRPTT